jgi:hypothetical protein
MLLNLLPAGIDRTPKISRCEKDFCPLQMREWRRTVG